MRSVSLINSNGTEIDTLWKKEYEVPVDRCRNETFIFIYTFISSKNSEEKKLEKVIEVVVMMGTYGIKFTLIVLFWRTLTAQSICIYITDTPK